MRTVAVRLRTLVTEEHGQALPVIALMLVVLLGISGMGLDVGRALYMQRQLQAATDAAALAGANALPASTAVSTATTYSAVSGNLNARTSLSGAAMVSGYPKVTCLTTLTSLGVACSSPSNGNAMVVKEQITIDLIFMRVVGIKTLTLGASSTAAARGGSTPTPYNVAIIVDSTLSMNETDSNCSNLTQMTCALNGVQVLLQALSPCQASYSTCTVSSSGVATNPIDQVALFTFPNVTVGTGSVNTNCTSPITKAQYQRYSNNSYYSDPSLGYYDMVPAPLWSSLATATAYTFPSAGATKYSPSGSSTGTYQVTGFLSNYRASDTATSLTQSSDIVQAAGGASNCGSLAPPNYDGDYGTYYAGAIYAAQAALVAQQSAYPGSKNVIVLLSDGDANAPQNNGYTQFFLNYTVPVMPSPASSSGSYPSYVNECAQGITAAAAAATAGTRVYTVAYGAPTSSSSCKTDTSSVTGCSAMSSMASATQYFYSDYSQSGATGGNCYSSQPVTSLSDIFTSIAADLTVARLIPDNTT